MHYRLLVIVELFEPHQEKIDGDWCNFDSYSIALGANADTASNALALAEQFVLDQHEAGTYEVGEAEVKLIPESQVPEQVISDAFSRTDQRGIYWASGRIFGEGKGTEEEEVGT